MNRRLQQTCNKVWKNRMKLAFSEINNYPNVNFWTCPALNHKYRTIYSASQGAEFLFLLYENHAIVAWFREALAVSNKKTPIVILNLIFRALRLGGRLAADLGVHV